MFISKPMVKLSLIRIFGLKASKSRDIHSRPIIRTKAFSRYKSKYLFLLMDQHCSQIFFL